MIAHLPVPSKMAVAVGRIGGIKGTPGSPSKTDGRTRRKRARKAENDGSAKARKNSAEGRPRQNLIAARFLSTRCSPLCRLVGSSAQLSGAVRLLLAQLKLELDHLQMRIERSRCHDQQGCWENEACRRLVAVYSPGTIPSHAENPRPLLKAAPLPIAAMIAVAVTGPMPGIDWWQAEAAGD